MRAYFHRLAKAQSIERAAREGRLEFNCGLNNSAPQYSIQESQKVWPSYNSTKNALC